MIDIYIVARKTIPDPYAPLELENVGPPKLAGTAMLSDSQNSFLGTFIVTHLPRKDHDKFRQSVLSRLSWGKPGQGAFKQSMRLAAIELGLSVERLTAVGLLIVQDRADTSRRGAGAQPPRRRIRRGKFD